MTMRRLMVAFLLALLAQTGVFAWRYRDLLYLRRPAAELAAGDARQFTDTAADALARRDLTRRHLDTIAEAAARLRQANLEVRALERRLEQDPQDNEIQLRLADAVRRAGDLKRAESLYLTVLHNQGGR